ncbi:M23 family metallopeptidase [Clostridium cellulovorans]|uniref:Peptidase M23 n=1 Tax=Clostridium cellulovorans (strain ATCC 35296 / DSM 3052 / OCM 3 / 743B) TaxID=573061 RepID=D9STE6_CLOC7|nr:M23 family metallopeptidase [Clostridium cellulovorans]ADL50762.1 Peptidase M23 [Clostridium cellulovorans 743B]
MNISTVPKDFIINAPVEIRGNVISNFLLHGLSIKNDTDETIVIKNITFGLYTADVLVKQIGYQGKALENALKDFAEKCTWLGEGFGAKLFLGKEGFFTPSHFAKTVTLAPNEETGIFNEYFTIVYDTAIDKLLVNISYTTADEIFTQEWQLEITEYHNKNQYIFPLKGTICTCGNFNSLLDHRQHYSMEFAIDMAQYNSEQKLAFKEDMKEEDYIVYGKDILAIADGEIVDCYHSFFMTSSWDWEERRPYMEKYGLAAQCGNYVVIKHANDEYSFYGHLIKDSLTVKKGDKVKQGEVIGKVGHTGLSNCPHLHFQLMDGPDFLSSKGLPCSFINIKDVTGSNIGFIEEDNIIVHAE